MPSSTGERCDAPESSAGKCDVGTQDDGAGPSSFSTASAPRASQLMDDTCSRLSNTSPLDIVLGHSMLAPPTTDLPAAACQPTARQSTMTADLSLDGADLAIGMERGVRGPNGCTASHQHGPALEWLPRRLVSMLEEKEDCLRHWSKMARDHVPMPTLELTRKSALRFHVQWHGICWPCSSGASLERVLTGL